MDRMCPTTEALYLIDRLKLKLGEFFVLVLSNLHTAYMIDTDASLFPAGAVLFQKRNDNPLRELAGMAYWNWTPN